MRKVKVWLLMTIVGTLFCQLPVCAARRNGSVLEKIDLKRGICVVLGDTKCELALKLAEKTELLIYVQLPLDDDVEAARRKVDTAGFYGTRIYVEKGALTRLHLADNLADIVVAVGRAAGIAEAEVLRVLRPQGKAILGTRELVKPFPEGIDDWSHPYHGPDNNPQSKDKVARAPYLTQFLVEPYYAPLAQAAVASAGRVFKAFGNIAFHKREEAYLNCLVAFNGYNGTIVWMRRLTPGVMIHRNTMIATPDTLYVGDDKSCKLIDTATGRLKDEIIPPTKIAGGTFWKWMALEDGILYALIGAQEQKDPVVRQRRKAHGWPWDPLSKGFNQPDNPWGFGRNLLAINPKTKEVLWTHRETQEIDSRALCMKNGRIYIFRYGTFLASLDAKTGSQIWRKTPENATDLFKAIGEYLHRQDWRTNWRTVAYMKCSDKAIYFAGPMVDKLLAVATKDGSVLWTNSYNNFQLVLRDDGLYAISGQVDKHNSIRFDPLTGRVLAEIATKRRGCTRPTGSVDSVLYRADGGTVRLDVAGNRPLWISPMRAQCHDGVTIANGLLYWWPSPCDCQNTIYGVTCLGPAGDFDFSRKAAEAERLEKASTDSTKVESLDESPADWPTFRANNTCNATGQSFISKNSQRLWWFTPKNKFTPTASVTAGGLVFLGGSDGIVRALDAETGDIRWRAFTGGAIRMPPTIWKGRVFVGSGDGWVYSYEAKTGRLLWRFRAAPHQRKIPVYGSLLSTWPVASGVLVEDAVAYLAAGILDYDGIHVYALDAVTGKIKWQNNTSGHLEPQAHTGVSVQGHMLINDGRLYLAGGTSVSPAVYDIRTGKCLNDPAGLKECVAQATRGRELYLVGDEVVVAGKPLYADPDYPVYSFSVTNKLLHTSADGRDIVWINNKKIMCFNRIDKELLNNCVSDPKTRGAFADKGWGKFDIPDKPLWEYDCQDSVAFARCKNIVLLASAPSAGAPNIEAIDVNSGKRLARWRQSLAAPPVDWGLAVDGEGRVMVTLEDGQVMCFGSS